METGFRVSPSGLCSFDFVRKRFSGFCGFYGFNGEGAAQKNNEAPRSLKYASSPKDGKPVNLSNLQNLFNL